MYESGQDTDEKRGSGAGNFFIKGISPSCSYLEQSKESQSVSSSRFSEEESCHKIFDEAMSMGGSAKLIGVLPSSMPSLSMSKVPSRDPSAVPTSYPSQDPSKEPSGLPSLELSEEPSEEPI